MAVLGMKPEEHLDNILRKVGLILNNMQIEKLLDEQEEDFDRKCEIREDKGGFTYLYERDEHLSSEAMFNWHKQSLKQFIDGLVEYEQEYVDVINRNDNGTNYEEGCRDGKEMTISHLKEIRAKME